MRPEIVIHTPSDVLSALARLEPRVEGGVVSYSLLVHTMFRLVLARGGHVYLLSGYYTVIPFVTAPTLIRDVGRQKYMTLSYRIKV